MPGTYGRSTDARRRGNASPSEPDAAIVGIYECVFPTLPVRGFRHAEISYYLEHRLGFRVVHGFSFGDRTRADVHSDFDRYVEAVGRPGWRPNLSHVLDDDVVRPELAYSQMVDFTMRFLPHFEQHRIPFCINITPGGGFAFDSDASDDSLRRIFDSPQFRHAIVTQPTIADYLAERLGLRPESHTVIYGGFAQIDPDESKRTVTAGARPELNIGYVAYNYGNDGRAKGFPIWCEAVHELRKDPTLRFHVVGNWDPEELTFAPAPDDQTIYHGVLSLADLRELFDEMDLIVNPFPVGPQGQFNGFPMSPDAGICGVALMTTNPVRLRTPHTDGRDVIEIEPTSADVVAKIRHYALHREALGAIAERGREMTIRHRSRRRQAEERLRVFEDLVGHEIPPAPPPAPK